MPADTTTRRPRGRPPRTDGAAPPIDWDWSQPNTVLAAQLGVTEAAVRKRRKRAGIPAASGPGRPRVAGEVVALRLVPADLARLDALATAWGEDRAGVLRRLVRRARVPREAGTA